MKIKLSKTKWQQMGEKAGWIKTAQVDDSQPLAPTQPAQINVLDGKSKQSARNFVNGKIQELGLTQGVFRDTGWNQVHKIWNALNNLGVDFVQTGNNYYNNESGETKGKRWTFEINFKNNLGKDSVLYGSIVADFGPSQVGQTDAYDLVFIAN